MLKILKIIFYNFLPKKLLTEFIGWIAESKINWIKKAMILIFIRCYKINMEEVKYKSLIYYANFNEFFSRKLKKDARIIGCDSIVMPADGIISQFGLIVKDNLLQAKNHYYSLESLLAGNEYMISCFKNGYFITTYLSPKDYHRIHMPCNGTLREMLYVPGNLFPLNKGVIKNIPHIFSRNERLICLFETNFGPMIQILIGSVIVGSIVTVWQGKIPRLEFIKKWKYPKYSIKNSISLTKGQEMGYFRLGSTVINLFNSENLTLNEDLYINCTARVGKNLAKQMS